MPLSETQKLQLLQGIDDEDLLREDLLFPLFKQMKKYELVDHTHGAFERGKDFVLVGRDELGDFTYTAVVVKCKDITNSTSGREKESVANVCTQVAASILSGYSCTIQNRQVTFNKILVITNGSISHSAREEIVKFAKQHQFTKVSFKSGQELIGWVDEYLPEFYTSAGGITSAYLGEVRKKCEKLDELKNISVYKGEARKLLDVFVTPTLYRISRPNGKNAELSEAKPVYEKLDRILFQSGHVMVLGGPGSGKSTLLRAQVQRLLNSNTRGRGVAVPVFVRAIEIVKYLDNTLQGSVNAYVRREYGLPEFDITHYMSLTSNTVYIFIDGLEEVSSSEARAKLNTLLAQFAEENRKHKLVLSSRETTDLNGWSIPKSRRWNLMPLKTREVKDFIGKWFNTQGDAHPLLNALQDHDILTKLPKTPLVVTLLAILFDQQSHTEVPANLAELYGMFLDLLLGRWNPDRRVNSFYTANIREFILLEIAEHMHTEGVITLSLPAVHYIIQKCSERVGVDLDVTEVTLDFIDTTGLLVLNDKSEVEFRHLSFQEFLVAKRYMRRPSEEIEAALRSRFADEWWAPVVYHYCGLKRENDRLLKSLTEIAATYDLVTGLKATWNFGYLVQASYLTALECRCESVEAYLRSYSERLARILEEQSEIQPFNEFAPAILLISLVEVFKLHYSSKFMRPVLERVYRDMLAAPVTLSDKLALLVAASALANSTSPDCLLDVYEFVKGEPLLDVALNFQLHYQLDSDNLSVQERKDVKKVVLKLQRKFRESSTAYRALTSTPKVRGSINPMEEELEESDSVPSNT